MDRISRPVSGRPDVMGFHDRNDRLFARRRELLERIDRLRERAATGESGALPELALRRAERELDEVTAKLVQGNYGLVRHYVALFTSKSYEHCEDFESAGKVGLLWAISTYDPARGSFASWAFKPIQREILRAVRDADHPNLNPGDFEKRPIILAAERALLDEAGVDAAPDFAAIAERAGVSVAQVRRVLAPPWLDSMHAGGAAPDEQDDSREEWVADPVPSIEEQVLLQFQLRAIRHEGLPALDSRERYVLTRRFGLDGWPEQPFRVIGEQLGLSREGVRQIHNKALTKLHQRLNDAV
ncbi:sigma-70 family RNA polymerase sigma factor [Actinomadura chokoriensis]|uniref:sigma-70 family RNA polymerase sigma factor n=1 Tax=Actinomadura chokoriensis TaxID=454156 RepID=UPI0031F792A7